MSGASAARALHQRFDAIREAEWHRLGRKVASLAARERDEVEAIVGQIVRALADRPARELAASDEPELARAALELFGIARERSTSVCPVNGAR